VETTASGLNRVLPGLTIKDVWSDLPVKEQKIKHFQETLKNASFFATFKKEVIGKKFLSVERRAKNILIHISGGKTILIHMKMTGHVLVGMYEFDTKKKTWAPSVKEKNQALRDPFNKFIHFVISLSNGKHLALSDMRKFAKITLLTTKEINETSHLQGIGPEPLEKDFTEKKMTERILTKKSGKIKSVLMDQSVIAGIGNIYSDEILWLVGLHPEERVQHIPKTKFPLIYKAMKATLAKGIDFGGDSMSDYRNIDGEPGKFQHHHNAYRKTGKPCGKQGCKGVILRKVVGGRSAHFCSVHQRLLKK
jgi:formamidopyrimidine-DNA glycosylase